ncbi:MAG: restriction endonuclease subunit S [Shewanella algae]
MSLATAKLADVAPAKALKKKIRDASELTWHLNLDQVESQTGRVIAEQIAPISEAGNSTHWFDDRHVLYSKLRPYLNKVVVPEKEGIATTELVPMLPDPLRLERTYLAHYLRSNQFVNWVSEQVAGAKMPRVSMKVFWDHEIHLPPLAEQKRIAAILDKADALRRKRQQAIDLADQFLRSVFLDMFGDPVTNPKGFDKVPLGDLIKVSSGNGLTAKDMAANGVHPVFGGNGINGYHDQYMFDKPKIVIGRVGAYCGVVHVTQPKSWVTDNALYVKESRTELQDSYLEHALKIANLNQYASQAGQPLISGSRIYPVEILLPPYGLQEKFQMLKRKSEKIHEELLRTKQVAENLFNSLSQKAFTGAL